MRNLTQDNITQAVIARLADGSWLVEYDFVLNAEEEDR